MTIATKIDFRTIAHHSPAGRPSPEGWRNRSILDQIGHTPMVHLRKINAKENVHLLGKLEFFNPGGSIKDRAALSMLEDAERKGELTKEKIVIEATSGNTGIGLALVCAAKGYRLLLAMSEAASQERKKILKNYGAQLILTPESLGTDGSIEYIYDLYNQHPDRYFLVDQFNNEMNAMAHYHTTGPEIWEQTGQEVTAVVCALGTTGTVMGIARRMKEYNPDIRVVGVEPYPGHKIQGLKNMTESYVPGIYDRSLLDRVVNVSDRDCFAMLRRLTVEEGLFVGMSSGAAAVGALKYIEEIEEGLVVVLFPDSGERYLSTQIYSNCQEVNYTEDPAGEDNESCGFQDLHLFNTLTRQKEKLQPIEPSKIKMYTCGPTVDRLLDLRQARRYLITDILRRYLEYRHFGVHHIVNITDIDDKTIAASRKNSQSLDELTNTYFEAFVNDTEQLGIKSADRYCRYSENVDEMIALTRRLFERGLAYEKHHSIYFDVSRYKQYGIFLNGLHAEEAAGTWEPVPEDPQSQNVEDPLDFTLFKRATLYELKKGLYYKTEWGSGRPSWHIGCAAVATKYLGRTYDIHISASMHMYPHNENTIATACALDRENLANYWLHVAPVLVNQVDMNEKAQNIVTVRELREKGYCRRQLRFFFLKANYRQALHYSAETMKQSCEELKALDAALDRILAHTPAEKGRSMESAIGHAVTLFEASLNNDLDIVSGLGAVSGLIFEAASRVEKDHMRPDDHESLIHALERMNSVLMILDPEKVTRGNAGPITESWPDSDEKPKLETCQPK